MQDMKQIEQEPVTRSGDSIVLISLFMAFSKLSRVT